jgi:predicted RNA binding protein with dsRBD fold (UPF0201 family)
LAVAPEALPSVEIIAETEVKKTESAAKVVAALRKLFGEKGELRMETDRVMFISSDLEALRYLKDQFRDRRVRSSARRLLLVNQEEGSLQTYLLLNKQAATIGIGALCDDPRESALSPIVLRLRSDKLMGVIDWLTAGYDKVGTS